MVTVNATDIYGFEIDDWGDSRAYELPSGQRFVARKNPEKMELVLGTGNNHESKDHPEFFQTLESAVSSGLEVVVAVDAKFNGTQAKDAEKKLAARLQNYGNITKSTFDTLYLGSFDEPEYVMLLAQCSDPANFDSFVQKGLQSITDTAKRSLVGNDPNYRFHVPRLVESMSAYIEKLIQVTGIPETIAGFTPYSAKGIEKLDTTYVRAIVQANGSSFTYDLNMQRRVKRITKGLSDDVEKSRAIFEWVISNISYDYSNISYYKKEERNPKINYRGALQTYKDKRGVCGESAAVQVTMERLAGNIAFLVKIEKGAVGTTPTGKIVNITESHACAAHVRHNGEVYLVDTTNPEGFGIEYDKFKIISDEHSFANY